MKIMRNLVIILLIISFTLFLSCSKRFDEKVIDEHDVKISVENIDYDIYLEHNVVYYINTRDNSICGSHALKGSETGIVNKYLSYFSNNGIEIMPHDGIYEDIPIITIQIFDETYKLEYQLDNKIVDGFVYYLFNFIPYEVTGEFNLLNKYNEWYVTRILYPYEEWDTIFD